MKSRNLVIIFVLMILIIAGVTYYIIKTKNNEIKQLNSVIDNLNADRFRLNNDIQQLNSNINTLKNENSNLKLNINSLNKEVSIFIEGCRYLKDGCEVVMHIKAKEFLKEHGIEETYLAFSIVPIRDTLESLYKSENESIKSIIRQSCPESYYIPSIQGREEFTRDTKLVVKKSLPHVLITDRDADITSKSWRQKAFIFFNETYDIICAWKIDITNQVPPEVYTPLK